MAQRLTQTLIQPSAALYHDHPVRDAYSKSCKILVDLHADGMCYRGGTVTPTAVQEEFNAFSANKPVLRGQLTYTQ